MQLQPVILSGGSGTRLWPLSREKHPKQLLSLFNNETMLQATALRVKDFSGSIDVNDKVIVVFNEEYRFITAEQLRLVGCDSCSLLLEPFGRNTAPALTLAALEATKTDSDSDSDSILLIMPADHIIADEAAFHHAIEKGLSQALQGAMVTFGIVPDRAETGYGYIEIGDAINEQGVLRLNAFVEKPSIALAQEYVDNKKHVWNSGIFMMKASVWLRAIAHLNAPMHHACLQSIELAKTDSDFVRIDKEVFATCPSDSIDYAVMEKLARTPELGIIGCVVPLIAGWSDVGAWDAVVMF
jgi:mannose-1-phosphate guanylyltransferase/mannose-6-phosphate isomerase